MSRKKPPPLLHELADVSFFVAFGDGTPFMVQISMDHEGVLHPKILLRTKESFTASEQERLDKFIDNKISHLRKYWGASLKTGTLNWDANQLREMNH